MSARILIVDDEAPALKRLTDVLDDCREEFPLIIADTAANGVEALEAVNNGGIDIVITDIRMPVMDGIEVARHLARMDHPPKLIFATAYDQYAVQAFELNAVDYLLKPIRAERLLAALKKARPPKPAMADAVAATAEARRRHFSIHERGKIVLVPLEEVAYLRAEQKYITVRTLAREHLMEDSLTRIEEEFGDAFMRVHRNTLVARAFVAGFERAAAAEDGDAGVHWVVVLRGLAERLPVSRRQQHVVREF
ncbi:MAG: response regulator transcription factor [Betaproteobacteria bacterium]|nr:response regulator transcription factor [Betaproteobacteria bacterium]